MYDPKINLILDEANKLFLQGKFRESIVYYDRILKDNLKQISSLNNKGYALSKLKLWDDALASYDAALQIYPDDLSVLTKISSLRKQGNYTEALSICNRILQKYPRYNVVLYHKE
ncbi:MAG: tetratricopeptide repeat protein [Nitrosopumilus sp.]|uniref:tetratricopeptide repeat protein n=1 Tax=Nitrosopumilus sp. TaxID=2024843 RepID=UPI0029303474|nr:tetratricopeptide repeat protein [Nitrosopumilus sp.]